MEPFRSRIEVYEKGVEDRLYDAVTDGNELFLKRATQVSGPKLDLWVSDVCTRQLEPEALFRWHDVYHQPEKRPVRMEKVSTRAEVENFKSFDRPGERSLICFIPSPEEP